MAFFFPLLHVEELPVWSQKKKYIYLCDFCGIFSEITDIPSMFPWPLKLHLHTQKKDVYGYLGRKKNLEIFIFWNVILRWVPPAFKPFCNRQNFTEHSFLRQTAQIHSPGTQMHWMHNLMSKTQERTKGRLNVLQIHVVQQNELQAAYNNELHNESGRSIAGKYKQWILSFTKRGRQLLHLLHTSSLVSNKSHIYCYFLKQYVTRRAHLFSFRWKTCPEGLWHINPWDTRTLPDKAAWSTWACSKWISVPF